MNSLPLQKDILLPRIDGIEEELGILKKFSKKDFREFSDVDFALGSLHLQRVLVGILNIGAHILSRFPGMRKDATRYQDIARGLGEIGTVPKDFADNILVEMAKYRDRLVHDYAEISKKELFGILRHHLVDCETFLMYIKKLIKNPGKFSLFIK